jgi:hypothetical protein
MAPVEVAVVLLVPVGRARDLVVDVEVPGSPVVVSVVGAEVEPVATS